MSLSALQNASSYLNNLLLARGLLANGTPIDFASTPDSTTQSQIINLIHDLILRRDRDSSHLESLATTIRQLRAEESQRVIDMQSVQDKNAELSRQLANAEAQQRALKESVRKAAVQAKELKDQAAKMKSMLDQVRAKCISDVRKRDIELEKLKGHLAGMQRGKRDANGIKINVLNPQTNQNWRQRQDAVGGGGGQVDEWSLDKETNNFLTAIVNETSSENVALRNIVKSTIETLNELMGMENEGTKEVTTEQEDHAIGIPGQYRKSRSRHDELDESQNSIMPCDTLEQQMNTVIEHCRTILKDPSFVPIEEVHLRDAEIIKLRMGWEKMASRWKEAVTMMDNWRRRMLGGDERIDPEELSHLEFGKSMAVLPDGKPVLEQDDNLSGILFHTQSHEDEDEDEQEEVYTLEHTPERGDVICPTEEEERHDVEEDESDLDIPPEPELKRLATSPARRGITLPRPTRALREINLNRDSAPAPAPSTGRSGIGNFDGSTDENENDERPRSKEAKQRILRNPQTKELPLSIAEKLAATEAEAREAQEERQRFSGRGGQKRKAKPPASTAIATAKQKRSGRRRSTLSPEEFAVLMGAS